MTVSNQTNRTSVVGDGTTQEIPFSFPASATSDIEVRSRVITTGVESDPLTENSDYTVSLSGDSGGTVTMITTFASTYQIHVKRNTPKTQLLNLEQGGSFDAENIEDALDKNTKLSIENADSLDRTLRFPETDADSIMEELPKASTRAGKFLYFGASDGNPSVAESITTGETTISTYGKTLIDDDNASAALTTLGFSAYAKTLIDDTTAAIARNTLGGGISFDVDKYASFSAAIVDIDTTQGELHIYSAQAVITNETVPSTLTLVFHNGGSLSVATTKTVTINGAIKAGLYQIFTLTGSGVVVFNGNYVKEAYPQWWGAVGDGATDSTTAFQNALASAKVIGGRVYAPASASTYIISGTLVIPAGVTLEGDGSKSYDNSKGTILDFSASTLTNAITLGETDAINYGVRLKGFKVKVGSNITNGIAVNSTQEVVKSSLEDIVVYGGAAVGIWMQDCWNITMREVISQNNVIGFKITNGGLATSSTIIDCIAYNSETYGWYIDSSITYTTFISCGVDTVKKLPADTGTGWYIAGIMRQCTFISCGTEKCWKYSWHFNSADNLAVTVITPNMDATSSAVIHDEDIDIIYVEDINADSVIIFQGIQLGSAAIPGGTGLVFKNDKLAKNVVFRDCRIFGTSGVSSANSTLHNSTVGSVVTDTVSDLIVKGSSANGQAANFKIATIEKTSMLGATVTATSLIPAGSLVIGVTARVTTLIETATSFSIGDGTDVDRWGTGIAVAEDTTTTIANFTTGTDNGPIYYPSATNVVLTAAGGNFSAGAVRLTVHYISLTAPTS